MRVSIVCLRSYNSSSKVTFFVQYMLPSAAVELAFTCWNKTSLLQIKNLVLSKFCQCEFALRRHFCKTIRFCGCERGRGCLRTIVSCNIWKILRVWAFETPRGLSIRDIQGSEFSRHPGVWVFETPRGESSRHPRVWVFRGSDVCVFEVSVFVTPVNQGAYLT